MMCNSFAMRALCREKREYTVEKKRLNFSKCDSRREDYNLFQALGQWGRSKSEWATSGDR